MKRKWLAIGIILLFVGTCIIPAMAQDTEKSQSTSRGNWLYVGGSGPGNYTKIQDAVDNATDNDTVFVFDDSSPYYENIEINRVSINLFGEDKNTTVIDGDKRGVAVDIHADNVTIAGFMMINHGTGIIINSQFNTIRGNNINEEWGIVLEEGTSNNVITENTLSENGERGIYIMYNSTKVHIIDNVISSHKYGILSLFDKQEYGILSEYSNNIDLNIINNVIFSNQDGILAGYSKDINITDNVIFSNNDTGISLFYIQNCTITGNIISNNGVGIGTTGCSHILIRRNTFQNNFKIGLGFYAADTRIEENNFINNTKHAVAFPFINFLNHNVWSANYWDNWIGLKFHGPLSQRCPKFILSSWVFSWPWLVIVDWHPAQEPYDI